MTAQQQLLKAAAEAHLSVQAFVAWDRLICGRALTPEDIVCLDTTIIYLPDGTGVQVRA